MKPEDVPAELIAIAHKTYTGSSGEPTWAQVLAAVFLGLAVLWWRTFSLAIGPISRVLRGRRPRRVLDAAAGSALLAISARVAVEGGR